MAKQIFHLNLLGKWFDLVESGEKKQEYRELTEYWKDRFIPVEGEYQVKIKDKLYPPSDIIICFSNGYKKERRQMLIQLENIHVGTGRAKWGAHGMDEYFVLSLGENVGYHRLMAMAETGLVNADNL